MLDLPPEWNSVFEKALAWQPRIYTCTWPATKSIEAVATNAKPVASHYPDRSVTKQVRKYRLRTINIIKNDEVVDRYIFQARNQDIAELARSNFVNFGREVPGDRARYFFVFGVCLGYPIPMVLDFCNKYADSSESLSEVKMIAEGK